jgi:hypothetical protein
MGKIKAVRSKKFKGGINTSIAGPQLPESLYKYKNTDKIKGLYDIYDENYKTTEKELYKINVLLDKAQQEENFEKELELKKLKEQLEIKKFDSKRFYTYMTAGYIVFRDLGRNIVYFVEFITSKFGAAMTFMGFAGQGVFAKIIGAIVVILIIVSIVLGSLNIIHGIGGDPAIINNNTISKSIVQSDNSNYIQPNPSWLQNFSKAIYNLIPSQYTYKLNNLSNSLTYITTGKNQFDAYLEDRTPITTGRWDDILHVSNKNENVDKIYSRFKPKNIILTFEDIYGSDYNKLPQELLSDIKYPMKYNIPINAASNGRFGLDLYNSTYFDASNPDNSLDRLSILKNFLPHLFIPDDIIAKNDAITSVKLNSINIPSSTNMLYCYGTTIINLSYNGPVLEIVHFNDVNIRQKIYYDTINKSYYYYKDVTDDISKYSYSQNELKTIFTYGYDILLVSNIVKISKDHQAIGTIFDQVGDNDLIFDSTVKTDARYPPDCSFDDNIIRCYFSNTKILYLKKPINFNNISIEMTIKVDDASWMTPPADNVYRKLKGQDLNLLASRTEPLVKIVKISAEANKYTLELPGYAGKIGGYTTTEKNTLYIKIDENTNERYFECLGNFHQPAIYTTHGADATATNFGKEGVWLLEQIVERTFIGFFYNLIIYDITS